MLEKALSGDRRYWMWMFFLGAIIAVGGLFYLKQFTEGLTVTGLSRDVVWGFYIAQFTFLVGVAASAVMRRPSFFSCFAFSGAGRAASWRILDTAVVCRSASSGELSPGCEF